MPTLRDHVRETLSARDLDPREAARDLDAVLARARQRRRTTARSFGALSAVAAAAAVAYLLLAPRPHAERGVHLYLRANGEPEARAIVLDLDTSGDL